MIGINRPRSKPLAAVAAIVIAGTVTGVAASGPAVGETAEMSGFYRVMISGVSIGKAGFDVKIEGNRYKIDGWGKLTGVLAMYSNAIGVAKAKGAVDGLRLVPARYELDLTDDEESSRVRINFADGGVKSVSYKPDKPLRPDRVPLKEGHKKGVIDPMSSLLVPHPAGETGKQLCSKSAAVFEGKQRFNLPLVYKKTVKVAAEDGSYKGIAHVCGARYRPVAGHVPARWAIRYMMENENLEVWLTPAGDTGYAIPWRITIGTTLGPATVEAKSFRVIGG